MPIVSSPGLITLGGPIVGGTAGRFLITDASGNLGDSANLTFNNTTGAIVFKSITNAVNSFQLQNLSGTAVFQVSTNGAGVQVTAGASGTSYSGATVNTQVGTLTSTSLLQFMDSKIFTVNQASGTGGYVVNNVQVTETAVGSAGGLLARWQVGAATKFSVDSTGVLFLNPAAAPSSPVNGHTWFDTTQKTLSVFTDGMQQQQIGCIFTLTSSVSGSTSTDVDMIGTGVGTKTLPANFFVVGKTVRIRARGSFQGSAANINYVFKVKVGGASGVQVATFTVVNPDNSATVLGWEAEAILTCRTTGATGTIISRASANLESITNGNDEYHADRGTAAGTVDTTASQALYFSVDMGTAAAFTVDVLAIEVLN